MSTTTAQSIPETLTEVPQATSVKLAKELGKTCSIAHTILHNPAYRQSGYKNRMIDGVIRSTRMARHVLRFVLPDYEDLIGIGGESFVFKSSDEDIVEKRVFLSLEPEEQAKDFQSRQETYQEFLERFGDLITPTQFSLGGLCLRPAGNFMTTFMHQPFMQDMVDIMSPAAAVRIAKSKDTLLEDDLSRLVAANNVALGDNFFVDTLGPANIVISNDSGSDRVCIPDVNTFPPFKMHIVQNGLTIPERLAQRAEEYQKLQCLV